MDTKRPPRFIGDQNSVTWIAERLVVLATVWCLAAPVAARADDRLPAPAAELKGRASEIAAVHLLGCDGRLLATMAKKEIQLFRTSVAQAKVAEGASSATPPWNAVLEISFATGPSAYAQLVYQSTLRIGKSRLCDEIRPRPAIRAELQLGNGKLNLYRWLEQRLGKTRVKEYSLPDDVPSPF